MADESSSDELVAALGTISQRPVTRGPVTGSGPVIYVGSRLPDSLRDTGLLWFHSTTAGVDSLLGDGRWPRNTLLTRTVGRMKERIAQYVLGWILAECQRVPDFLEQHQKRCWQRLPTELADGHTAVVFGVGRIGATVCEFLHRCGIHPVGVGGRPRPVSGCDRVISVDQVHDVLPEARWVVSTLPLTPATQGMFDREMFASMRGATFINVGRGATVDLAALAAALADETVGSAVLDVLAGEPAGPDAPCWDLPRTVVTSHSSGLTYDEDVTSAFATCWHELRNGQLPQLAVSPGRGY